MKAKRYKTRLEEINEMIAGLRQKMAWTPGWLKTEIDQVVRLEIEKALLERSAK